MPRKNDRYPYLREVELEFTSGKRTARISDISMGGCYIDTIAQAPIGEPVTVLLTTSAGVSMSFNGKVAYLLEGFGFGIEFINLTDVQSEFLRLVVESAAK